MNILFYTYSKVHSTKGGTERTTISAATGLSKYYACKCFSLYEVPADTPKEECFIDEFCWSVGRDWENNISYVRRIIVENNIDVLIDQGTFIYVKHFRKAVEGLNCKIIFAHHFEPGCEATFVSLKRFLNRKPNLSIVDIGRWVKNVVVYPYIKKSTQSRLKVSYREAYQYADRVVLLSNSFIEQYMRFGGFKDSDNFSIIPNGLSFNDYLRECDIKRKKHVVLIVARFDDSLKRISLALRIWKNIKKRELTSDWRLDIVGHGKDEVSKQ